jgi:signal transduction histidine kinase
MNWLWHLLSLDRIAGQIRALLVVAIVVGSSVVAATVLLVLSEQDYPEAAKMVPVRVATLVATLENLPRPLRAEVAASLRDDRVRLSLDGRPPSGLGEPAPELDILKMLVARNLPANNRLLSIVEGRRGVAAIVVQLADGQLVTIEAGYSKIALLPLPLLGPLILLVISVVLLSIWAAHQVAAPLSRFAAAADQFGGDVGGPPLDERGPAEIRRASHAFNRMRERISRLIEDRTNLLLAISHDLRTPLTRLRLRIAELAATDEAPKARALDDIATMESSITAAVTYLREGTVEEAAERVELASMLTTICDQFADSGHPVDYVGPPRLAVVCRPRAIDRAVTNLVDNATKYAAHVRLVLSQEDGQVCVEVQDDGPGIPDDEKPRVVKPFYRSDPARQEVRGFGLGLAIVSSIVQAEGGTLVLLDNAPRGLRARITLPVS